MPMEISQFVQVLMNALILPWIVTCLFLLVAVIVVFGLLRRICGRERVNRSQFAAAVARAKLFWRELDVARSDFIDNRAVELWKVSYAADFSLLTKEPRRAGKDVLDIADVFNDLRRHVDRMNAAFIREESARNDGLFGRLDKSQREACVADEVATLVVAGAGSGKTSTIEKKVEYLIKVRGVSSDDILLLAFTNKAADEMTERLAVSMPNAFMVRRLSISSDWGF